MSDEIWDDLTRRLQAADATNEAALQVMKMVRSVYEASLAVGFDERQSESFSLFMFEHLIGHAHGA